jgi:queuosine precursor transporter
MNLKYLIAAGYIAAIILSNYFASTFIFDVNGVFSLTVGTVMFGIVFFLRDVLHKYGKNTVYVCIFLALVLAALYNLWAKIDSRIIIASGIALLIGEITDTELFDSIKTNNWASKAMRSNVVSVPVDSVLFNSIAFFGTSMQDSIFGLTIGDIVFKMLIASFFTFVYYFSFKRGDILNFHK